MLTKVSLYMKIDDVTEWLNLADNDLYSAEILFKQDRKPLEIICNHCAKSAEKYLKGYLAFNEIIPQKTHNLTNLLEMCKNIDPEFIIIKTECGILNRYSTDIRYPSKIEILNDDAIFCIKSVKNLKSKTHSIND